ncbi:DUF5345 family protein [Cohnella sp. AR92]|uniref:DUF5345 family protein n=1 Tax=Cohnella sp. AR92 TaxID=648716 RepID=UPI000F8D3A02|nr:DUF5345 family protein [Cohnella sp. AR92]RUS47327.1 hypothetical protein ELR57_09360 [Cohnella sp. AR92]
MARSRTGQSSSVPPNRREIEQTRTEAEDAQEFESLFGDSLRAWDAGIDPPPPHLLELEKLVVQHREETGRKLWRELSRLWLIGLLVIGVLFGLLQWNVLAFAVVQVAAIAAAAVFLFLTRKNKEAERRWTN